MRSLLSNLTALIATAVAVILVDQTSKAFVMRGLADAEFNALVGGSGFRRRMNKRGGLIPLSGGAATIVWIGSVSAVVLAVIAAPRLTIATVVGMGLVVGGAASNLGDRIVRGAIVDFIDLPHWPTFNLADLAMSVGTAVAIWTLL